jgi:hypothetical protein
VEAVCDAGCGAVAGRPNKGVARRILAQGSSSVSSRFGFSGARTSTACKPPSCVHGRFEATCDALLPVRKCPVPRAVHLKEPQPASNKQTRHANPRRRLGRWAGKPRVSRAGGGAATWCRCRRPLAQPRSFASRRALPARRGQRTARAATCGTTASTAAAAAAAVQQGRSRSRRSRAWKSLCGWTCGCPACPARRFRCLSYRPMRTSSSTASRRTTAWGPGLDAPGRARLSLSAVT